MSHPTLRAMVAAALPVVFLLALPGPPSLGPSAAASGSRASGAVAFASAALGSAAPAAPTAAAPAAAAPTAAAPIAAAPTATAPTAAAPAPIGVYLDGLTVDFDVPPTIVGGRTLVPFRRLAEALGCDVVWDAPARSVWARDARTGRTVILWIGDTEAKVSGKAYPLDVPAMILDGRTLIPLRFFGEAFGAEVSWDGATRVVTVKSATRAMTVLGYYALGDAQNQNWAALFGRPYPGGGLGVTDVVSEIACAWYVLDAVTGAIVVDDSYSGQKRPDNWQDVLDRAAAYGIAPDMMVHWARLDGGVADEAIYGFLEDPVAMGRAVSEIASCAAAFRGVNLDIEYLGQRQSGETLVATRRNFTVFVRRLGERLHADGRTLTLSLHPQNSWYPGYDWPALGAVADRIVLMAYGYLEGRPQPLDKVTEAVDLALKSVPKDKLLLGLLPAWETPESLAVKVGLAKRRDVAGIALWRLNNVSSDQVAVLRRAVSRPPVIDIMRSIGGGPTHEDRTDLAAAPPLLINGRYYVPLAPLLRPAGIPFTFDPPSRRGTVELGAGGEEVLVAPASDPPDAAPDPGEPAIIRGELYVPVETLVDLVRRYAPPGGGVRPEATWDPDTRRLVLVYAPGAP